jgi:hypothetical protein
MLINKNITDALDAPKNKQAGKSKNEDINVGEDDLISDDEADDEDFDDEDFDD